jgi:hypothetical protein
MVFVLAEAPMIGTEGGRKDATSNGESLRTASKLSARIKSNGSNLATVKTEPVFRRSALVHCAMNDARHQLMITHKRRKVKRSACSVAAAARIVSFMTTAVYCYSTLCIHSCVHNLDSPAECRAPDCCFCTFVQRLLARYRPQHS